MKNNWFKRKQVTAAISAFSLIILIIGKSYLSDKNMESLDNSFSEIYNDRLVVESYVYRLSDLLYKKKIMLLNYENTAITEELRNGIQNQTDKLNKLVKDYSLTKLTENEGLVFEKFKTNVTHVRVIETELRIGEPLAGKSLVELCDGSITQLQALSSIQLSEGKLLQEKGKQVLLEYNLVAQFEWVIFITLLLLLVFLLKRRVVSVAPTQAHQLN